MTWNEDRAGYLIRTRDGKRIRPGMKLWDSNDLAFIVEDAVVEFMDPGGHLTLAVHGTDGRRHRFYNCYARRYRAWLECRPRKIARSIRLLWLSHKMATRKEGVQS